jgi:hypothetical protein
MRILQTLDGQQESPLARIPDQVVSLRYKRISLEDFFKEISNLIHIDIDIDKELANEKLCIIVNKMSVAHLLRHIATLYRSRWGQTATGIALRRTDGERQLEQSFVSALKQARLKYWQTQYTLTDREVASIVEEFFQQQAALEGSGVSVIISPLHNFEYVLLKAFLSDWTRNDWEQAQRGFPIIRTVPMTDIRLQHLKGAVGKALWEIDKRLKIFDDYRNLLYEKVEIKRLILTAYMSPDFSTLTFILGLERSDGKVDFTGLKESVPEIWLLQNKQVAQHPLFRYWRSWSMPSDKYANLTVLQKVVAKRVADTPHQLALLSGKRETTADFLERLARETGINVIADAYRKPLLSPIREPEGKALTKLLWFLESTQGWMRIEDNVLLFRHWNYPELSLSEISEREWNQIEIKIKNKLINIKVLLDFLKNKRLEQQVRFQEGVEASELDWKVVNIDLFLFLSSLTYRQLTMLQHNRLPFSHLNEYQKYFILFGKFGVMSLSIPFRIVDSVVIIKIITDKDYANDVVLGLRFARDQYTDQQLNEIKLYYQEKVDLILFLPNNVRKMISAEIRYSADAKSSHKMSR